MAETSPLRLIPAHVHLEVSAEGHANRKLQLVFDDDPRMNDAWRRWAADEENPILVLEHGPDGVWRGSHDVVLEP